ncbi:MAG: carboxypeptidase regulatory-like domain-containing protein [Candidatus Omnitrophota bacterium]
MKLRLIIPIVILIGLAVFLYYVTSNENHTSPGQTTVTVEEGTVELKNLSKPEEKETLHAGDKAAVSDGKIVASTDSSLSMRADEAINSPSDSTPIGDNAESETAEESIGDATTANYWITGYVRSTEGKAIPDTEVRSNLKIEGNNSKQTASAKSNQEGYYTLELNRPGQYWLYATPPDHYLNGQANITVSATESTPSHDFALVPAGLVVSGTVIDRDTSKPVADANVRMNPAENNQKGQIQVEDKTGPDGRFTLRRLAEGVFRIGEVRAKGYVTFSSYSDYNQVDPLSRIVINEKTQSKELLIKLEPGAAAAIQVYDRDKKPISDADVKVHSNRQNTYGSPSAKTDAKGKAVIDSIPKAQSIALVKKKGYGETLSASFQPGPIDQPTLVEVTLSESGSVSGKVTEKDGTAIANRSMYIMYQEIRNRLGGYDGGVSVEETKTNENGDYSFSDLGAGAYQITVQGPDDGDKRWQEVARKEITLTAGEKKTGVDIILEESDANEEVKGKVVNQSNEPVKEANVTANVMITSGMGNIGNHIGIYGSARTDEQGEFHITGLKKADKMIVSVQCKGYKRYQNTYDMNGEYLSITMEHSGSIKGIVIAQDSRQPVEGAQVTLVGQSNSYTGRTLSALTDENGAFLLEDVEPGVQQLRAKADKYALSDGPSVTVKSGETVENALIELETGKLFVGLLLNPEEKPVAKASIGLLVEDNNMMRFFRAENSPLPDSVVSQEDGMFRMENLPSNGGTLRITHENYAAATFKIDPSMYGDTAVPIHLQMGGTIEGRVLDEKGNPLPKVDIRISQMLGSSSYPQTQTDEKGEYRFQRVSPGTYLVSKTKYSEKAQSNESKPASVQEGKTIRVDFGGGEGAAIHGTVYKEGAPAPGARILLQQSSMIGNSISLSCDANDDGIYRFLGVSEGEYTLYFTTQKMSAPNPMNAEGVASVKVEKGQSEYVVDLYALSLKIDGIVKDAATGEPLSEVQIGMRIDLKNPDIYTTGKYLMPVKSDQEGKFALQPRAHGEYSLTATKEGYVNKEFSANVNPANAGDSAASVFVEVALSKAEGSVKLFLTYGGAPYTAPMVQVMLMQGASVQQVTTKPDPEQKGVYILPGMSNEPFDLFISGNTGDNKPLVGVAENVNPPKGAGGMVMIDMLEFAIYQIVLQSTNGQVPEGEYKAEIPDFPFFSKLQIPQKIMSGMIMLALPKGHHLARLKVPGYRAVEFYPDEKANAGPAPMIKNMTLSLEKE